MRLSDIGGKLSEGYRVVPGFDREKYQERQGLEGPFHTKSGKVVYYDKQEGKYYDPDTDMYIEYEDWQAMNEQGVAEAGYRSALGQAVASDMQKFKGHGYVQDVAEGPLDNPGHTDSPVASAITRRILLQRTDLLGKFGPERVMQAIDSVADFVGDVDEIGSSDVSGWIRQVERELGSQGINEDKGMTGYNAFKREWRAKHGADAKVPAYDSKEYTSYVYQQNDKKKAVAEGAKVDRMVKHIAKSEREAGKSADEAEDIAWATANKRGMLDNKNKKAK